MKDNSRLRISDFSNEEFTFVSDDAERGLSDFEFHIWLSGVQMILRFRFAKRLLLRRWDLLIGMRGQDYEQSDMFS